MITFLPSLAKQCIKPFSRKQHHSKPLPACTYLEKALFWKESVFRCFFFDCFYVRLMHWSCGVLIHGTLLLPLPPTWGNRLKKNRNKERVEKRHLHLLCPVFVWSLVSLFFSLCGTIICFLWSASHESMQESLRMDESPSFSQRLTYSHTQTHTDIPRLGDRHSRGRGRWRHAPCYCVSCLAVDGWLQQ